MPLAGQRITASIWTGTVVAPIVVGSAGTTTSGTTETFDTVLGYLQATLTSGRRYRVSVDALNVIATVAGDWFDLRIRDSGDSSDPTSSDTQIAHARWYAPVADSSSSGISVSLTNTFLCATGGMHTFGMSAVRLAGTGTLTPANTRTFLIEDVGGY